MDIVTVKSIHATGLNETDTIIGKLKVETFTIIFDDHGTEKVAVVACKPEFKETVEKALLHRLMPLKFKEEEKTGVELEAKEEGGE